MVAKKKNQFLFLSFENKVLRNLNMLGSGGERSKKGWDAWLDMKNKMNSTSSATKIRSIQPEQGQTEPSWWCMINQKSLSIISPFLLPSLPLGKHTFDLSPQAQASIENQKSYKKTTKVHEFHWQLFMTVFTFLVVWCEDTIIQV